MDKDKCLQFPICYFVCIAANYYYVSDIYINYGIFALAVITRPQLQSLLSFNFPAIMWYLYIKIQVF